MKETVWAIAKVVVMMVVVVVTIMTKRFEPFQIVT